MKTLSVVLIIVLATFVSGGGITQSYYGKIESLADCERFNDSPGRNFARATASASGSAALSRGTWKIVGNSSRFAVEDCYKKLVDPKKIIIFTISKEFEKLKVFPRGQGWLNLKVVKGPNAAAEPDHVPPSLDDASFKAVVFGLVETEAGPDTGYSKEQLNRLIRVHDAAEVRAERFIQLNNVLVQHSAANVLRLIADQSGAGIVLYQDSEERVDIKAVKSRLGDRDIHFMAVRQDTPAEKPDDGAAPTGASPPSHMTATEPDTMAPMTENAMQTEGEVEQPSPENTDAPSGSSVGRQAPLFVLAMLGVGLVFGIL